MRVYTEEQKLAIKIRKKKNQTPDWLTEDDIKFIELFYIEARRLTMTTGIKYEVDHIKPIALGGLHEPNNLQIITAAENRSKGALYVG